jgi:hypothetical protein
MGTEKLDCIQVILETRGGSRFSLMTQDVYLKNFLITNLHSYLESNIRFMYPTPKHR